jgi:uncharacterized protein (UPF0548 family)
LDSDVKIFLHEPRPTDVQQLMGSAEHATPGLVPGASFDPMPAGLRLGGTGQQVGSGTADFERAQRMLRAWAFLPRYAQAVPGTPAQQPGQNLVLLVKTLGVRVAMPARVLETIEPTDDVPRAGFVYTALPGHVAQGYERFLLELDPISGAVTFELRAVSIFAIC